MRGNWGEVLLERVLEASGLQKGREYDLQVRLRGPAGKIYQPDAIVRLPAGKDVIVDAKMTLNAYARYHDLDDDADRRQALKQHVDAVRGHVRNLAAKPYDRLQGVHSLDFVLMFIPVEAAFLAAAETDNRLWQDACGQNIMIVSPSTLLLTLRIIHNVWRHEYQNRNTLEIARQAGALHDKFVGFVESLTEVGDRLDKAAEAYHTAFQRLTGGRGNLVRRAHALKRLGARASRELPADVLAAADVGSEI
jgi:DNA recombination protein RmuC